jgi:hypothetical protein
LPEYQESLVVVAEREGVNGFRLSFARAGFSPRWQPVQIGFHILGTAATSILLLGWSLR